MTAALASKRAQSNVAPPGNIWQHLVTFLVVTTGGKEVLLVLVGRGQKGCYRPYSTQEPPSPNKELCNTKK